MAASSTPQTGPREPAGRFLALSAIYASLIVAATLVISSLIHDGHGMLDLSFGLSLGIAATVGGAAMLAGLGTMRKLAEPMAVTSDPHGFDGKPGSSRRKCEMEVEEWFAFLEEAKKEFYVAGHTMGKWCDPSRRGLFVEQVRRLLAAGGTVTLVALGAESPQVAVLYAATEKDYSGRIAATDAALAELRSSLDPTHRERLRVKQLDDNGAIPYMVVGNETRLVTATYLARTDSDDMPCFELGRDDEAALAIYDDLHKLAGLGAPASTPAIAPGAAPRGVGARLLGRSRRRR